MKALLLIGKVASIKMDTIMCSMMTERLAICFVWCIVYTALGYKSDCILIGAVCSTGIIPNIFTFVHQTISYSLEIFPEWFEVATTTAFGLIEYSWICIWYIFNCSTGNSEIMGPLLDSEKVVIRFINCDCCMQNMQIPFHMVLEQHCWRGARGKTFQRLRSLWTN